MIRNWLTAALLLVFVLGCGQTRLPTPSTYKARGNLRAANGEPVKNVIVHLEPFNPQTVPAQGVTDTQGSFILRTFSTQADDGAMPGKFKVWLQPSPTVPARAGTPIPAKYQSAEESDVTVVIESGQNELKIQLK